jgi:catalase
MVLASCERSGPNTFVSNSAAKVEQPPVELGEQWGAANDAHAEEILSAVTKLLKDRSKGDTLTRRDAHPKHHGCVKAFFKVDSSALPENLQVGIFSRSRQGEYPAWIRFSNGNPGGAHSSDLEKDIRGMAVKLMNVTGTKSGSHDFVMLTSKEFVAKDGEDYLHLHRALIGSGPSIIWHFITHGKDLMVLLRGRNQTGNPLQLEYFSSVPYKLGPLSMKFKARTCASNKINDDVPQNPSKNYLRERLVDTLKAKDVCYELLVQPNMDPGVNVVEKANSVWDEGKSPYVKVATIAIPRQENIDSEKQLNFCENISFDPWQSLPDTRPLGQINRMRLVIYQAVSRFRHDNNHVAVMEPRSHNVCTGETALLCKTPMHSDERRTNNGYK